MCVIEVGPSPDQDNDNLANTVHSEEIVSHRRLARSAEPTIPLNILQRLQLYKAISMSLSKIGVGSGETCVLRAICEAAMTPPATDEVLVGELVGVALNVAVLTTTIVLWGSTANATLHDKHQHSAQPSVSWGPFSIIAPSDPQAGLTVTTQNPNDGATDISLGERTNAFTTQPTNEASPSHEDNVRYFEVPEGIASIVLQPTLKKRISIDRSSDLFVGIACPIEIAIAHPALQRAELFENQNKALPRNRRHVQNEASEEPERETVLGGQNQNEARKRARSAVPAKVLQRLHIFQSIEATTSTTGLPYGRECIQRAICESAKFRLAEDDQLMAEILIIMLR
ncbi:hypothetical protein BIW11_05202, partial [Tropilaelaps mercedesae]